MESHYSSSVISRTMGDSHSPTLVSPPDVGTPPVAIGRRGHNNGSMSNSFEKAGSEPIDANRLSHALKSHEEALHRRERTPGGSPSRKRQRINREADRSDRLVLLFRFDLCWPRLVNSPSIKEAINTCIVEITSL